ncbi:MAG: hypothetical protein HKN75_04000 [Bacteroidia bacterium]|nr:hypothetical protein [Bacteroidia bacterium]
MTTELDHLTTEEKAQIIMAPALVSVYAALYDDGKIEPKEKADAIRLAHLRTFTSDEILHSYYKKVDEHFEEHFNELVTQLPDGKEERNDFLESKLKSIGKSLSKVESEFAEDLARSLKSFSRHVFRSNSHFLEYFILPGVINHIEKTIFSEN